MTAQYSSGVCAETREFFTFKQHTNITTSGLGAVKMKKQMLNVEERWKMGIKM